MNSEQLPPEDGFNVEEKRLIGELLIEAGIISHAQLEIALADQTQFHKLKLGEILALRGWVKPETVDFLINFEYHPDQQFINYGMPVGYFLEKAGLLDKEQIEKVLTEQNKKGKKFCETAVEVGFIKDKTATFFLQKIINSPAKTTFSTEVTQVTEENEIILENDENLDDSDPPTAIIDLQNQPTDVLDCYEEIIITPQDIITVSGERALNFFYGEIAYSPINIDYY
ncbi:MAG: hypothetical protein IGQ45_02830 [Cyanobacterium sp. T60_A2020_053]|nr:hypothetical protein [Cyanobacterium sp. T60_A2020_053]